MFICTLLCRSCGLFTDPVFSGTEVFVYSKGIFKAKHALKMHPVIKLTAAPQNKALTTKDTLMYLLKYKGMTFLQIDSPFILYSEHYVILLGALH